MNSIYGILVVTLLFHSYVAPQKREPQRPPQQQQGAYIENGALTTKGDKENARDKYTTFSTTTKKVTRSTPKLVSMRNYCDYLAYYCLRAYRTGKVCARTLYREYHTFDNYCLLDYMNCMEGYEVWQIVHIGDCFKFEPVKEYKHTNMLDNRCYFTNIVQRFTTEAAANRKIQWRTIPNRISQRDDCDYLAKYCMRAYRTGALCGRTLYFRYYSFTNYCLLDYVNCKEGYEVWQVLHMGQCFNVPTIQENGNYDYTRDDFLDEIYIHEY